MRVPLWVEASRVKVLILGGGSVGTRRAKFFQSAGAKVRVIAREFGEELTKLNVEVVKTDLYHYDVTKDVRWADVVVIAVDDRKLADKLFQIAESLGKLVNDATDASRTHIVVPYERTVSNLRIAVTSEGAAGTPARISLDLIEECIKNSWIPTFYSVYSELKKEAKMYISDTRARLKFYQELWEDEEFRKHVVNKDVAAAIKRGKEILQRHLYGV
ncbi:MAG: bifunctional precorrin-2 dehydrogenase/sirohydrochlorin ferrochelatase [Pyrobaculum sp.]